MSERIAVLGAGAWGTALAVRLAEGGARVTLWARDGWLAHAMLVTRENHARLPGVTLPDGVLPTQDLRVALDGAGAVLLAAPVVGLRAVAAAARPHWPKATPAVLCAKGFESDSLLLPHEVVAAALPDVGLAALSGPTFAHEVARGLPAAAVLAGTPVDLRMPRFRLYASDDIVGAEVGGAVKNVVAIAAGAVVGAGLGENARAALVTRGLAEIARLAVALGGRAETVSGLSGLGDLFLTANGGASRNFSLGLALGQGRSLAEVMARRTAVTEGVATAPAALARARALGVDMPVTEAVAELLAGRAGVAALAERLLSRPARAEQAGPQPSFGSTASSSTRNGTR
jgi:glycerol-3-phosphate dehydrogenase (NAD(P)+)